MSASDTTWAEGSDAYQIGRDSRDAEVAGLKAQIAELTESPAASACPVRGAVCPEHEFVHGREAEELRAGIEDLVDTYDKRVPITDLRALLDRVDAHDSLAFCEAKDGADHG